MKMNTDSIVNRKAMKANMLFLILGFMLAANAARAQWTVIDPSNLTQGIINSTNEMVNTSATAENMLQNFQETVKIYQQAKAYYDKLQAVSDLVRSARKIQKCILLVGEISGIYVNNYEKMLADKNFSAKELSAVAHGYTLILQESTMSLKDLQDVITPTGMSMTDKERLDRIDGVHAELMRNRNLAAYHTRKTIGVSMVRSKKRNDMERVMALYGKDEDKYW